jgi:hypothetical protein
VFVAMALVTLAGCGKGTPDPVRPDQVEVYMPGDEVSERFQVLADIKKMASAETADSVLVMLAVAEAATYGADALVIRELREYEEGRLDMRRGYPEKQKRLLGSAVRFPDRHQQ